MKVVFRVKNINNMLQPKTIIMFTFFLLLWILLGFNTKTVDMDAYKNFYRWAGDGICYPGVEYGFYLFMRLCTVLGFQYSTFLAIYALVGVTIMYVGINKLIQKNKFIVLLLFVFFPYLHIIAALRNFMAFSITLFGIHYLTGDDKYKYLKYVICVMIASLFHTSMLFALIYLFVKISYNKIQKLMVFCVLLSFCFIQFQTQTVVIMSLVSPKIAVYLAEGFSGTRFETKVFLLIYFIAKYFICRWIYLEEKPEEGSKGNILNKICILSIAVMPMSFFNMNFMRIEYNAIIIMSVLVFFERCSRGTQTFVRKNQIIGLYTIYYIISGYILLYLFSYESVVKMFWQNNSFFDLLF